jgi:hypothetical protein
VLLICSPVGLHLLRRLGTSVWQQRSPPGVSVLCGMERLCVGCGFGGVKVLLLLGGLSCQVFILPGVSPVSQQIFAFQTSCYLLPLSSHHFASSSTNSYSSSICQCCTNLRQRTKKADVRSRTVNCFKKLVKIMFLID